MNAATNTLLDRSKLHFTKAHDATSNIFFVSEDHASRVMQGRLYPGEDMPCSFALGVVDSVVRAFFLIDRL